MPQLLVLVRNFVPISLDSPAGGERTLTMTFAPDLDEGK
jgi:hypothetical protein